MKPRTVFACLTDADVPPNGPTLDVLTKWRECYAVAADGRNKSYYVSDKDYMCKDSIRHRAVKKPFFGSTVFHKKSAAAGAAPVEVEEPEPVCPNSFDAVSFQLSAMVPELQAAQAKDPGLKDILMY